MLSPFQIKPAGCLSERLPESENRHTERSPRQLKEPPRRVAGPEELSITIIDPQVQTLTLATEEGSTMHATRPPSSKWHPVTKTATGQKRQSRRGKKVRTIKARNPTKEEQEKLMIGSKKESMIKARKPI